MKYCEFLTRTTTQVLTVRMQETCQAQIANVNQFTMITVIALSTMEGVDLSHHGL